MTTIATPRLELVLLDGRYLERTLARAPHDDARFADPHRFLDGAHDVVELRLAQLRADAASAPWLLRAVVLRATRAAIGFATFHAAPDADGRVELGYEVLSAHRGHGYAGEATAALAAWATRQGARILRASVRPDNAASLAIVRRQGFVQVGTQLDEIDGLELVFEKML